MKSALACIALVSMLLPGTGQRAAAVRAPMAITVSVSPAGPVRDGATVTVTARTTRSVSDIWVFDGSVNAIEWVLTVTACDALPNGGFTRCVGHARHAHGVISFPGSSYRQSKKSGRKHTFFACWDTITTANCSRPATVVWSR